MGVEQRNGEEEVNEREITNQVCGDGWWLLAIRTFDAFGRHRDDEKGERGGSVSQELRTEHPSSAVSETVNGHPLRLHNADLRRPRNRLDRVNQGGRATTM